jgi:hypothetical protein
MGSYLPCHTARGTNAKAVIIPAALPLCQFGIASRGSFGQAQVSLVQVFTVGQDSDENTLTWSNAPLALENIGRAWVDPLPEKYLGLPGAPRMWDVSRDAAAPGSVLC